MKNNHNGEFEVKVEGELQTTVESQDQSSSNMQNLKSGGNAPSDLGAIKNSNVPNSASNTVSRSNLDSPSLSTGDNSNNKGVNASNYNENPNVSGKQANNGAKRINHTQRNGKKEVNTNNKNAKTNLGPNNKLNPLLNQNRMKNFGKNKDAKIPNINSSASFFDKAKGLFNGKNAAPKLPGVGGFSSNMAKKSITDKFLKQKSGFSVVTLFNALPIQIKIAIGGGIVFLIVVIILIIMIASRNSAAEGNREMKDEFIKGDYTEEQLCEYLEDNHYLLDPNGEAIKCQDHPAYKFFVNVKEVMDEYEEKYARYRFQVNVELLYETMAYFKADEEFYKDVTKEEITNLIDAMIEEIEESCVIKIYDEKTKKCSSKTKYVYTLYEFSLNKYISYLKYGTTSTHPNYGNNPNNTSSNGKAVTRICGEGKNTDYVFGFGLVNTSSSPLSESSNCPNEPVTDKDYENLPKTVVTLEELGAYGGVPYYDTVSPGNDDSNTGDNGVADRNTTKNVVISPSHQDGPSYAGIHGLSEKDAMYQLAPYLKKELESRGYNVFLVDINDGSSGLKDSHVQAGVNWLNGAAGIYIALHSNAGGGGTQSGPEVLFTHGNANSETFAEEICSTMKALYNSEKIKNTRSTCETNYSTSEINKFYKKGGKGAAALVEVGFHDNADQALWITRNYAKIAKSLADAIDNYRKS